MKPTLPVLAVLLSVLVSVSALSAAFAPPGRFGPSSSPSLAPAAGAESLVTWSASEYCSDDAHPGFAGYVVPFCVAGAGYAAPPAAMYNATGQDTGVPVWMSASNNSSGEVVVLANSVLTRPTSGPVYDYPTMWAYLPARGWLNLTAASGLGRSLGTLGYDLARAGGCMAWDPQQHYFLVAAGQNQSSSNFWSFTYTPGSQPLPGGTWTNRSSEITGWNTTGCEMAWYPPGNAMVLDGTGSGYPSSGGVYATWSGGGGWSPYPSYYTQPPCAHNATMAYDPVDREIVWFGGVTTGCTTSPGLILSYTWAYTGGPYWSNLSSSITSAPPAREWASVTTTAYGAVLLGGDDDPVDPSAGVLNDTWIFVRGEWSPFSLSIDSGGGAYCPRYAASTGGLNATAFLLFGGATTGTGGCPPLQGDFDQPFEGGDWALNDTWTVTGVAQSPSDLRTNATGLPCSSADLSWTQPAPPYGQSVVNDTVFVYDSTGDLAQAVSTNGPAASTTVSALECSSAYSFRVQAWFSAGLASPLSAALGFLTGSASGTGQSSGGNSTSSTFELLVIVVAVAAATAVIVVAAVVTRRGRPSGPRRGQRR
ncbi:MAG: fibronectin type III domain-containing protein [Acidimicrobiales bacterium]